MTSGTFIRHLSDVSFPNVFNPYRDWCDEHDHPGSPEIRCSNLRRYLDAALSRGVDSLWVGRDCGYRGGRRTGIALTDEIQLDTLERHFAFAGITKATIGVPVKERTATAVWKTIREVNAQVFLWNAFPFHPFEAGKSLSNRPHTAREFDDCKHLLICIIEWLQPQMIFALGADAYRAVERLGFKVSRVRHPSYGGHIEFSEAIRRHYGASTKFCCP